MQLRDSVVLITGAGQGIGQAIATYLARRGCRLALLGQNLGKLENTAAACLAAGSPQVRHYACNVADEAQVIEAMARIDEAFSGFQALVNNAGITRDGLTLRLKEGVLQRMGLEQWQGVQDVNLTGTFLCTREAAGRMLQRQQPGVIVNIASIARAGHAGQANYSAAKAGVVAASVAWAQELARYGIRVAALAPGLIGTEMVEQMPAAQIERMLAQIPLRRAGTPEEVAHSVAYLLENDYFNGRVLELDGGLRL